MRDILARLIAAMPDPALEAAIDRMSKRKRLAVYHALRRWNLKTGNRKVARPIPLED